MKRTRKRRCHTGILACDITKEQLAQWFHLPSHEACSQLGISLSVLKRVCRKLGIPRWPYRSLTSSVAGQPGCSPHYSSPSRPSTPPHPSALMPDHATDASGAMPASASNVPGLAGTIGAWEPPPPGYASFRSSMDLHGNPLPSGAAAQLLHTQQGTSALSQLMGLEPPPAPEGFPAGASVPPGQTSSVQLQGQLPGQDQDDDCNGLQSLLAAVAAMDPLQPRRFPRTAPLPISAPFFQLPQSTMLTRLSSAAGDQQLQGTLRVAQLAQRSASGPEMSRPVVTSGQTGYGGRSAQMTLPNAMVAPRASRPQHQLSAGPSIGAPQSQGPPPAWGASTLRNNPPASTLNPPPPYNNTLLPNHSGNGQHLSLLRRLGQYSEDVSMQEASLPYSQHSSGQRLPEKYPYGSRAHVGAVALGAQASMGDGQGPPSSRLSMQHCRASQFDPHYGAQFEQLPPAPPGHLLHGRGCGSMEGPEQLPWTARPPQDERRTGDQLGGGLLGSFLSRAARPAPEQKREGDAAGGEGTQLPSASRLGQHPDGQQQQGGQQDSRMPAPGDTPRATSCLAPSQGTAQMVGAQATASQGGAVQPPGPLKGGNGDSGHLPVEAPSPLDAPAAAPEDGGAAADMTAADVTALSQLLKKGFKLVQSQPNHPLVGQLANVLKDVLPTSA